MRSESALSRTFALRKALFFCLNRHAQGRNPEGGLPVEPATAYPPPVRKGTLLLPKRFSSAVLAPGLLLLSAKKASAGSPKSSSTSEGRSGRSGSGSDGEMQFGAMYTCRQIRPQVSGQET
jgi:hypothetical protein